MAEASDTLGCASGVVATAKVWSFNINSKLGGSKMHAGAYSGAIRNPDHRPVGRNGKSSDSAGYAHQHSTSRAQSLEMTARLPLELILHIVNLLHDDKIALSACSLCCSALAIASKPLLFRTLRTTLESDAAARFEGLLELGPAVLPLIKRIDMGIPTSQPTVDCRTIQAIARIMRDRRQEHNPSQLNLATRPTRLALPRFGQLVMPLLDPVSRWVTSLELEKVDLTEDIQFWHIVRAFPILTSLSLGCVNVGIPTVDILSYSPLKISHLSLKKSALGNDCNIRWFLTDYPMPLPSLMSLDVRFPTGLDRGAIVLGEQYGTTVRTLRFGVVIAHRPAGSLDEIACKLRAAHLVCHEILILPLQATAEFISRFENLEALTLQGLLVSNVPVQRLPITFEWIPFALEGVSPTVQRLTMEVVAAHLSYLGAIPWSAIDEILAHKLQSVTIVEILLATPVGTTHLLENTHQEMGKRLPLAARRGVLLCSAVAEHPI